MRIDEHTQRILENLEIKGTEIVITERLDRPSYKKVNDVLEALGGKWNTRRKAHVFGIDAAVNETELRELVEATITGGVIETLRDSRKKLGWFPTPAMVAERLVGHIPHLPEEQYVLEPSAGEGAIVLELLRQGYKVLAVEIDKDRARTLAKKLPQSAPYILYQEDFLLWTPPTPLRPIAGQPGVFREAPGAAAFKIGAVVMNPPFIDHLEHVRRAFSLLAPGGMLVSVLPNSVEFRQDKKHAAFRAWLDAEDELHHFHALEPQAFRSSGTDVNTVVLTMRKRAA